MNKTQQGPSFNTSGLLGPPPSTAETHMIGTQRSPMLNHQGVLNIWQHNAVVASKIRNAATAETLVSDYDSPSPLTDREQRSKYHFPPLTVDSIFDWQNMERLAKDEKAEQKVRASHDSAAEQNQQETARPWKPGRRRTVQHEEDPHGAEREKRATREAAQRGNGAEPQEELAAFNCRFVKRLIFLISTIFHLNGVLKF